MALQRGQVLQDRYRIVSLLGKGGMGAVYRAWDTRLNIAVALKEMIPQPGMDPMLLADLRQQFRQEAVVLARLSHPHLVRVSDFFEAGENAYLVMEFVEGEDLATRIKREGALSEDEVLALSRELLDALIYCHDQGIIHRDIKPQNVIIRPDGRALLVDFGLVKLWDPHDPRTKTAMRGMGTPEYAPPEQYDVSTGHTDARSDIYSLGATIYHALTGQMPPTATMRIVNPQTMKPVRALIAGVTPQTEGIIDRAMALQPAARFQSAREMLQAIEGEAVPARPVVAPQRQRAATASAAAPVSEPMPAAQRRTIPGWVWVVGAVGLFFLLAVCGATAWGGYELLRPRDTPFPTNPPVVPTEAPVDGPIVTGGGTIEYGQTVSGAFETNAVDHWEFEGNVGDLVTISMQETDGGLDTYLELYDPNGNFLTSDDDGGGDFNSRIAGVSLPGDGVYLIVARGFSYQGGSYTLSLSNEPVPEEEEPIEGEEVVVEQGEIEYGDTVVGTLPTGGEDRWTFAGSAGDVVRIAMEETDDDLDTYLELYDSAGDELVRDDDSGDGLNSLITYRLLTDGVYTIVARGFGNEGGSYQLSLTLSTDTGVGGGEISYGETVEGTLLSDDQHFWTFEGSEGDRVTIAMNETDGMDTYLELYDPDGQQLTTDDDGGDGLNSLIEDYELPSSGTYTIVARGFANRSGSYTLTLSR